MESGFEITESYESSADTNGSIRELGRLLIDSSGPGYGNIYSEKEIKIIKKKLFALIKKL